MREKCSEKVLFDKDFQMEKKVVGRLSVLD